MCLQSCPLLTRKAVPDLAPRTTLSGQAIMTKEAKMQLSPPWEAPLAGGGERGLCTRWKEQAKTCSKNS